MENNIREIRRKKGLTAGAVAKELGLSAQAIVSWETGKSAPIQKNLDKLCSFFECSENELYPAGIEAKKTVNQLAALRQRAGLTQDQIARAVWVPRGTYVNWERGEANVPLDTLPLLCRALNCTYDELAGVTPVELPEEPETPLKAARKWTGKTQKQIAEKVGFSATTYREIEQGKREPSLDEAIKIAEALGVKVSPKFKELFATTQETEQDAQIALKI